LAVRKLIGNQKKIIGKTNQTYVEDDKTVIGLILDMPLKDLK
jgi:hypothetical protein